MAFEWSGPFRLELTLGALVFIVGGMLPKVSFQEPAFCKLHFTLCAAQLLAHVSFNMPS